MKIAVYVEGQTELIFIREFLLRWYDYQISFRCYNLRDSDPPGHPTEYSYGDENADLFYEIVNVGNDTSVLSKAIKNAARYQNLGYSRIIVLRDMYCDDYHSEVLNRTISKQINDKFIAGAHNSIAQKGFEGFINCHFAIMEVEAWILGMGWFFEKLNPILTAKYIYESINLNIDRDPEVTEYHPANRLNDIYSLIGKTYGKHKDEVDTIMSCLYRQDFIDLLESDKCNSFREFKQSLTNEA